MGIQGLLSYCLEHREQCVEYTDLVELAHRRNGIEILCDFYSFEHLLLRNFWKSLEGVSGNQFIRILGGEYRSLDAYVTKLINDLNSLGIKLVMFVDGAKGSSNLVTQQKLETWKFRHEKDIEKLNDLSQVYNGQKRITDLPDSTSVRPVLLEVQIFETLKECKCEIVRLAAGEADYVIARNLTLRPKAFAVISNDSDFCIFKDCCMIPNELFDVHKSIGFGDPKALPEKPERLVCGTISSNKLISLLQFNQHSQLIELSIITGNDFTGHHVRRLRGKLGFRARPTITDFANWIIEYRNVENHPLVDEQMKYNKEMRSSVEASRKFYAMEWDREDINIKGPLSQHLVDNIQQGDLPGNIFSMHQNLYWHRMLMEDISFGHPCAEVALSDLRSYIYKMVLDRRESTVVEYGRTPDKLLDSYEVNVCRERRIRTVDHMDKEKKFQNLRTFHMAMTHLEPNFDTEWYKRYGWKNGCICYCLRYFLVLNTGAHLNIGLEEFLPIIAMVHCQVDENWYQSLCLLPTLRCVSVGNWFQDIFRHAYQFLGKLLNLTDEFPLPKQVFKGAVWTAFYMVNVHENIYTDDISKDLLRGPAQFPHQNIMRIKDDMKRILSEKQHIIKYIVQGYHNYNQQRF